MSTLQEDDLDQPTPDCQLVIFGASGDLAHRKLLPAILSMAGKGLLPDGFAVTGVGRTEMDDDGFRRTVKDSLKEHAASAVSNVAWSELAERLFYVTAPMTAYGLGVVAGRVAEIDAERGCGGNRLYYLAVPPGAFPAMIGHMRDAGLARESDGSFARIVIEKPFGRDLISARELNDVVGAVFDEAQVYRIDHYLGKETVQNLLVLRFANGFFEPTWDRRYIDHVEITVAEDLGIGHRAAFYEETGALRDIVQNHLLQLLCVTAMEPPARYDADSLRTEKLKVLTAIGRPRQDEVAGSVVRGQYENGHVGGDEVAGYLEEDGVASDSATETFIAWKVAINNWRWAGTPFYLRTGKRLPRKTTEIILTYRQPPFSPFAAPGADLPDPNILVIRIQPEEGVTLRFGAKVPVPGVRIRPVSMDFFYGSSFAQSTPDAYERLLLDAMRGDASLFPRADEVDEAWKVVTPLLEHFAAAGRDGIESYDAGTWGPSGAGALIAPASWYRA